MNILAQISQVELYIGSCSTYSLMIFSPLLSRLTICVCVFVGYQLVVPIFPVTLVLKFKVNTFQEETWFPFIINIYTVF